MNTPQYKPVVVTDLQGNETEYPSQTAAARVIGCTQSTCSQMCRGYIPSWKGYKVRFKNPQTETARVVRPIGAEL